MDITAYKCYNLIFLISTGNYLRVKMPAKPTPKECVTTLMSFTEEIVRDVKHDGNAVRKKSTSLSIRVPEGRFMQKQKCSTCISKGERLAVPIRSLSIMLRT